MAKGLKTGGRVKGTPNYRTQAIQERLQALNCDPIEGMATIAKEAMKAKDFPLALSAYKELAQYVAPKRKAVELSADQTLEPLITKIELVAPKFDERCQPA